MRDARLGHLLDDHGNGGRVGGEFGFELDRRSLTSQVLASGGATVPEGDLLEIFIASADSVNPFRTFARQTTLPMNNGTDHKTAMVSDVAGVGSERAENATVSEAGAFTFSQAVFRPRNYHSGFVRVPYELLEDQPQIAATLQELCGRRVGRSQRARITTDLTATLPTVTAASATSIGADDIAGVLDAVHENCQDSPAFSIMAHPTVCRRLFRLKDGQGAYLLPNGRPFDVRRVLRNPDMPAFSTLTTGSVSVFAGDFASLAIIDHNIVSFAAHAEKEGAAEADQIDYEARLRSAHAVLDDNGSANPLYALVH